MDSCFRSVILRLANHTGRFYALSPSEVCSLASSSATRVLPADREPSSRRIPRDENRLSGQCQARLTGPILRFCFQIFDATRVGGACSPTYSAPTASGERRISDGQFVALMCLAQVSDRSDPGLGDADRARKRRVTFPGALSLECYRRRSEGLHTRAEAMQRDGRDLGSRREPGL
jgi:hypothetical protein